MKAQFNMKSQVRLSSDSKHHDALLKRNCWGLGVGVYDVVVHGLSLFIDLWTHSQTISVLDVLKTRNAQR